MNCIREACSCAVEGDSYRRYERTIARSMLAGARVGHGFASRTWARETVAIAALTMQHFDADDILHILPGLGIGIFFISLPSSDRKFDM